MTICWFELILSDGIVVGTLLPSRMLSKKRDQVQFDQDLSFLPNAETLR
jgi:hypothetical protein